MDLRIGVLSHSVMQNRFKERRRDDNETHLDRIAGIHDEDEFDNY